MTATFKALSLHAPWWWFILHEGKDIENRNRHTSHRGKLLVHATKYWDEDYIRHSWRWAQARRKLDFTLPPIEDLSAARLREMQDAAGCIVGVSAIANSVTAHASPWFQGPVGWVLDRMQTGILAQPIPWRGQQYMFEVPVSALPDWVCA